MIWEGLDLMVIGMGTVFAFLTLLVFCTHAMSRVIARYFPEAVKPVAVPAQQPKPAGQDDMLAAVSAAVHHHRQRH